MRNHHFFINTIDSDALLAISNTIILRFQPKNDVLLIYLLIYCSLMFLFGKTVYSLFVGSN